MLHDQAERERKVAPGHQRTGRVARTRELLRQGGVRLLAVKVLGEVAYRSQLLVALELEHPPTVRSRLALEFAFLDEAEADEFLAFHPYAERKEITARLVRGERCLTARHRGRLVSAVWASTTGGPIRDVEPWPRISSEEVYVYDAFTTPSYRGWGAYPALTSELAATLATEGYRRMVGSVTVGADQALRAHELAGYRRFGTVGRLIRPVPLELHVFHSSTRDGRAWRSAPLQAVDLERARPHDEGEIHFELSLLDDREMDEYLRLDSSARAEGVAARFARGERCILARRGSRLVAAVWIASRGPHESRVDAWVRLVRDEAFLREEHVAPELDHRAVTALRAQVLRRLGDEGVRRALLIPSEVPVPGARRLGRVGRFSILGRKREFMVTRR